MPLCHLSPPYQQELNLLIIPLIIPAPYLVRGKLQQESISSGSLFSQGQAWIPVSTGMTEWNMQNQKQLS
jgi:hypothetical protein